MDYIINPIVKVCNFLFGIMEKLGNIPNWTFIVLGFVGMFYWLNLQGKYNKIAKENKNQLK